MIDRGVMEGGREGWRNGGMEEKNLTNGMRHESRPSQIAIILMPRLLITWRSIVQYWYSIVLSAGTNTGS